MSRHLYRFVSTAVVCSTILALLGAAAKPAPFAPGLIATYTGGGRTVVRVAPAPNFTLAADESVHQQIPVEFTVRYDGVVRVLREGDYTFGAAGDGGAVVRVDGRVGKSLYLAAGDHAIRVEFTRRPGPARLQLVWSSDGFPDEPIPPAVLGHTPESDAAAGKSAGIERGRLLVQEYDCVACHRDAGATLHGRPAPDLSAIGSRAKPAWVEKWLEKPRHFRPTALMPAILRDARDRKDVATYLSTLKDAKPAPRELTPTAELAKAGRETFESVGCVGCHGKGGVALEGQASKWTTASRLSRYLADPLATDPGGRMPSMMLDGKQCDALAAYLFRDDPVTTRPADFDGAFSAGDAARGRVVFASAGCLNCHTAAGAAPTTRPAVDLARLDPTAGCLGSAPPPGAADYHLDSADREAIADYLQSIREQPEVAPSPILAYEEHVRQFNCVACHATGGVTNQAGLDGVPPLSIAGQKLRPDWIRAVLVDKQRVRPWLHLRMPHFGPAVEPVAAELVAVSGAGPVGDLPAPTPRQIAAGRRIVGKGADDSLSCITCHAFDNTPPPAPEQSRGPELTLMARRLRGDWFHRWVREPTRVIPNTVMPSFFTGKPPADVDPVIDRVWDYFSLGQAMPVPEGLADEKHVRFDLVPKDGPIVQRCYLEGGGQDGRYDNIPRAVAVGLPDFLSYAFDPESCRLRYAWTGGFLDMTKGWTARGNTHGRRVGAPFYTAPPGPPIYLDSLGKVPVTHYVGYAFTKGRVEIIYTVDGVEVREWMARAGDGRGAVRTFAVDPGGHELFLAFAADPRVQIAPVEGAFEPAPAPAGWDPVDKALVLRATGSGVSRFSFVITPAGEVK